MAYASITYTSASGTTFALTNSSGNPIQYLRQSDIAVTVNGTLKTQGTDYTFNTAGTAIVLNTAVSSATVVITRTTSITDATVSFTAGSTLTAQDLNNSDKQNRFALQEFSDTYAAITTGTGDLSALAGFIGSAETWLSDNAHAATTGAIDGRVDSKIDTALTGDVVAGNAITITDNSPSSGQITIAVTDGAIEAAELASNAVTTAKITDGNVTAAKLASDSVTTAKILDANVTTAKIANSAVTEDKLANSAVTNSKIASGAVDTTKMSGATVVTNSEVSGVTVNDTSFFTTSASDLRYFRQDSAETIDSGMAWSSSDSFIATTAAIDARIIDLVDDVGGFVPIANETSFPATNPDINNPDGAGTIISIKEIVTTRTPSSGTVTIANGSGSNTVTINGCGSTVLASGFGVLVETTSTLHTYNFHRLVPKATEVTTVASISGNITTVANNTADITTVANDLNEPVSEIETVAGSIANVDAVGGSIANVNTVASNLTSVNSFANVYRIASSDPTTSLDTGDLVFNTTSNRLRVYNGTAWQDGVTATGDLVSKTGDTMTGALGITSGSAGSPSLFISGDTNTGLYSPGADQVAISTSGIGRVFVGSAGDVGIGGSPSGSYKLEVKAGAIDSAAIFDSTNAVGPHIRFSTSGTDRHYLGSAPGFTAGGTSSDFGIRTAGYLALATGGNNERLRITSDGKVGLGTSAPQVPLDLISDASGYGIAVRGRSSDNLGSIRFAANNYGAIYSELVSGATYFALNVNSAERLRVDSSGRLGVGTANPGAALTVATQGTVLSGTGNNYAFYINPTTTGYVYLDALTGSTNNTSLVLRTYNNGTYNNLIQSISGNETTFSTGGTERARIDSSGRLGIGTSSVTNSLHVVGSGDAVARLAATSDTNLTFSETTANKHWNIKPSAGDFYVQYSSTAYNSGYSSLLTIKNTGAVGIGVTSPGTTLSIGASASGGYNGGVYLNRGAAVYNFYEASDGTNSVIFGLDNTLSNAKIGSINSYPIGFYTGNAERARIDTSGRLLVGTSSTLAGATDSFLQIRGNSSGSQFAGKVALATEVAAGSIVSGTDLGAIYFGNAANGIGGLIECKGDAQWGTNDYPGRLVFSTTADGASSPTERMRIGQNGFTKISNSGTYNDAAGTYHEIMTNLTGNHALLCRAPASYSSSTIKSYVLTAAGTGFNHFNADSNGTAVCVIRGDGNLLNVNNSYGSLSDIKLKENIVDANSQWDDIKALQVRNYNFKEGQTHTQIGLIAQEVELVSPGLVSESPDRDEDGNDLGTVTKSVNYSVLYMKAVKALQEAMERIETLEAKVAALESA